jgi:glycosyltransferase involved in cell wall biosynthesis
MGKSPLLSVVMSIYDEPSDWLICSIESILNQTFRDFEYIIINDNPDMEFDLVKGYMKSDDRIIFIKNETNIGLTKSLNKGIRLTRGKYIARMDADDISELTRFEKQINVLESNENIGVCGSWYKAFGKSEYINTPPYDINDYCFWVYPFVAHSAVMIRKSILFEKYIFYNELFEYSQDFELWSRLYFYCKIVNIQEVLLHYRISNTQISFKKKQLQSNYAKSIRRNFIHEIAKNIGKEYILNDSINFLDVKRFKKCFYNTTYNKQFIRLSISEIYASTQSLKFITLIYFIISLDIIRQNKPLNIIYCILIRNRDNL